MNTRKSRLIVATAVVIGVAIGLLIPIMTRNAKKQNAPPEQDSAASATSSDTARQESIATDIDSLSPRAKPPVLKISGKENPDVYLQTLDIQVEVAGSIASTRYTMVFKNKTGRVLEGELTFPLPDGRAVTHYALDINGKMREAVPVEKASGTRVFEEIEQRRVVVDPGLLERVEGNNFRTRVYPIPAYGTRSIAIGYEEELALEKDSLRYRLPMAYPDSLEKFTVKATVWKSTLRPSAPESADALLFDKVGENYVASFAKEKYRPARSLSFALPAPADIPRVMMQPAQGSHYFLASVAPKPETRKKKWDDELAIIWDVSLSGSQRDLKREMEILNIIFAEKKNAGVHLYFLNNRFKKTVNKRTSNGEYNVNNGNWAELKKTLEAAVFDGGTDFSQINLNDVAGNEILFFSDGISTLGDADFIKNTTVKRPIHCVVSSAKADYSAMKTLAGKSKGKFINTNALSTEKLKDELLNETLMFLGTEHGKSVREVYPGAAAPVHGNFSAAGISDTNDAELTLLFGFGDKVERRLTVRLDAKSAGGEVNAYKIWAQKKIAELDLDYEKNRAELTELGRRFGIVTRNTSLIVLESVDDYILYGITPPVTEPELYAEYQRLTKGQKRDGALLGGSEASAGDIWESGRGVDDLLGGLTGGGGAGRKGVAGIGYGSGYGSGLGGGGGGGSGGVDDLLGGLTGGGSLELRKTGELKIASPDFMRGGNLAGGRSRAAIQQVVMQNMAALRYAYNKRRREKPGMCGKITVKFTIDEFGRVVLAYVAESTINDSTFEQTIVSRIKGWNFGKIDKAGDMTETTYPFVFTDDICKPTEAQEAMERAERQTRERAAREAMEMERALREARERAAGDMLNEAVMAAENIKQWRNTDFAFPTPKYPMPDDNGAGRFLRTGSAKAGFVKNTDYLKKMTGKTEADYQTYLKARKNHANSPTFYFDMASWFHACGDKETALRVLTSIADLELENAALYRLLGYRLKEFGEYALEKFVCQKVVQWRPMEPQSHRDYALALADNGEAQAALNALYGVLTKNYSENIARRNSGIWEVTVTEINRLLAKNPNLNKSKIHKHLLFDIPVDARVVINWNINSTDIDLHVVDPNGEACYYGHRETKIGGRLSADATDGYGPEQFLLKKAVRGKYKAYVKYYGDRQVTDAGPSTVMAEIYTKYADKTETRKVVCLQMSNARQRENGGILVAEFEF